ncbi:type II toxin-antitoxin system HicA family toxin [Planktothrix mougeotii]|uniref:Type II toxin-antitoxin system HicA family toxin n=1 Tax=Planktothrix mougeotii LEGE 06226 TaxID=1828728 RepID=A0ABR9UBB4_9CYAN|nr:type II toxin-antitoxin system HicA family toxin [Planktothrix mougeotii]MBE9143722.1 type II toxin-antitoxin system HicA family toxin [Planktothrix mougeotii LEGE 06226]
MSKIPNILGKQCIKALAKIGHYQKCQQGSHIILRKDTPFSQVTVPNHQNIAKGTLRSIIKSIGLTVDQFIELL